MSMFDEIRTKLAQAKAAGDEVAIQQLSDLQVRYSQATTDATTESDLELGDRVADAATPGAFDYLNAVGNPFRVSANTVLGGVHNLGQAVTGGENYVQPSSTEEFLDPTKDPFRTTSGAGASYTEAVRRSYGGGTGSFGLVGDQRNAEWWEKVYSGRTNQDWRWQLGPLASEWRDGGYADALRQADTFAEQTLADPFTWVGLGSGLRAASRGRSLVGQARKMLDAGIDQAQVARFVEQQAGPRASTAAQLLGFEQPHDYFTKGRVLNRNPVLDVFGPGRAAIFGADDVVRTTATRVEPGPGERLLPGGAGPVSQRLLPEPQPIITPRFGDTERAARAAEMAPINEGIANWANLSNEERMGLLRQMAARAPSPEIRFPRGTGAENSAALNRASQRLLAPERTTDDLASAAERLFGSTDAPPTPPKPVPASVTGEASAVATAEPIKAARQAAPESAGVFGRMSDDVLVKQANAGVEGAQRELARRVRAGGVADPESVTDVGRRLLGRGEAVAQRQPVEEVATVSERLISKAPVAEVGGADDAAAFERLSRAESVHEALLDAHGANDPRVKKAARDVEDARKLLESEEVAEVAAPASKVADEAAEVAETGDIIKHPPVDMDNPAEVDEWYEKVLRLSGSVNRKYGEDAAQQAVVDLFGQIIEGKFTREQLGSDSFLRTVLKRKGTDSLRRQTKGVARGAASLDASTAKEGETLVDAVSGTANVVADEVNTIMSRQAVDALLDGEVPGVDPADLNLVRRMVWEGVTGQQMAQELGISTGAVSKKLKKAKENIGRALVEAGLTDDQGVAFKLGDDAASAASNSKVRQVADIIGSVPEDARVGELRAAIRGAYGSVIDDLDDSSPLKYVIRRAMDLLGDKLPDLAFVERGEPILGGDKGASAALGVFWPSEIAGASGEILLNVDDLADADLASTLAHELVHAVTSSFIRNATAKADVRKVKDIADEMLLIIRNMGPDEAKKFYGLQGAIGDLGTAAGRGADNLISDRSVGEFVAEVLSNGDLRKALSDMDDVGLVQRVIRRVKQFVMDVFGAKKGTEEHTALRQALDIFETAGAKKIPNKDGHRIGERFFRQADDVLGSMPDDLRRAGNIQSQSDLIGDTGSLAGRAFRAVRDFATELKDAPKAKIKDAWRQVWDERLAELFDDENNFLKGAMKDVFDRAVNAGHITADMARFAPHILIKNLPNMAGHMASVISGKRVLSYVDEFGKTVNIGTKRNFLQSITDPISAYVKSSYSGSDTGKAFVDLMDQADRYAVSQRAIGEFDAMTAMVEKALAGSTEDIGVIAKRLGMNPDTLRNQLARSAPAAKAKLDAAMTTWGEKAFGISIDDARRYVDNMQSQPYLNAVEETVKAEREISRTALEYAYRKGMVSEADYAKFAERGDYYTPLARIMDETGQFKGMHDPFKMFVGSERMVANPVSSVLDNFGRMVAVADSNAPWQAMAKVHDDDMIEQFSSAARKIFGQLGDVDDSTLSSTARRYLEKNNWDGKRALRDYAYNGAVASGMSNSEAGKLASSMVDELDDMTSIFDDIFDFTGTEQIPGSKGVIIDGQRRSMRFKDNRVIQQVERLGSHETLNKQVTAVATLYAKTLRWSVSHDPFFSIRNFIRDTATRPILSKSDSGIWDVMETIGEMDDEVLDGMSRSGAIMGGWQHTKASKQYTKHLQRHVRRLNGEKNVVLSTWDRVKDIAGGGLDWVEDATGRSELRNRYAEWKAAKAKLRTMYPDASEYDLELLASSEANDLLDFNRMGRVTRWFNPFIPFLSPRVQGGFNLVRAGVRNPQQAGKYALGILGSVSVANYAIAHASGRGKEYDELPAYRRDFFWNLPMPGGYWIAVPKPFEAGVAGTFMERGLDAAIGGDRGFEGYLGSAQSSLAPFSGPDFAGPFKPLVEVMANRDLFRDKSIVPPWEEDLDITLRKGAEGASGVGKILHSAFGWAPYLDDPRKFDHIIQGTFAGFGRAAVDLTGRGDFSVGERLFRQTGALKSQSPFSLSTSQRFSDETKRLGQANTKEYKAFQKLMRAFYDAPDRKKVLDQVVDVSRHGRERLRAVGPRLLKAKQMALAAERER